MPILTKQGRQLLGVMVVAAIVFVALGYFLGHRRGAAGHGEMHGGTGAPDSTTTAAATIWTCSMHPQIQEKAPGKCRLCGMDLIPLVNVGGDDLGPRELRLTAAARKLAQIQTEPVERRAVTREVRMVGTVDYDETRLATITAWVGGRLDRLFVDYTGVTVKEGDHMVWMYSPEILAAEEELIQAGKAVAEMSGSHLEGIRESAQATLLASRDRLRLWGLSTEQIAEIEARGKPSDHIQINAPMGGVVIHKNAEEGVYVQTGTPIYRIADLSRVWVQLDAYESDLPWLRYGQEVSFTSDSLPGEIVSGRISFIDPVLTRRTRTVKVRVNVTNSDRKLKPGMFVRGLVRSRIAASGKIIDTALAGKWVSPMHPEVVSDAPGNCTVCGMPLVRAEDLGFVSVGSAEVQLPLVIPATAPLLTGTRAVVYVRDPDDESRFAGRTVVLGARAGDYYLVESGLTEGELVVVSGNFKIDSALQISAQPAMMSAADATSADLPTFAVTADFLAQLGPLFDAYLDVHLALAADDRGQAGSAAAALRQRLHEVEVTALVGPAAEVWDDRARVLHKAAAGVVRATDLESSRVKFARLSAAIIAVARQFGIGQSRDLYVAHCPMAFDNTGADWLQATKTIANPFFGSSMLRCGGVTAALVATSPQPHAVPAPVAAELGAVTSAYLDCQQALAGDQLAAAQAAAAKLQQQLAAIDMSAFAGAAHDDWMAVQMNLTKSADDLAASKDVELARGKFERLSAAVEQLLKRFGNTLPETLQRVHCPMAFDNEGADWLQRGTTVANPYFGSQMPTCGKITGSYSATIEINHGGSEHHE